MRCPEGSRNLRFPDYVTMAQDGGKVVSLMHHVYVLTIFFVTFLTMLSLAHITQCHMVSMGNE
jgi:hypothetical protein